MSDQDQHEPSSNGDEFWGSTPDWTDRAERPRRRRKDRGDITGSIKRVWDSALSAGSDATREHRVLDASTPTARRDASPHVDFFGDDDGSAVVFDTEATTEVPVIDARRTRRPGREPVAADQSRRLGGLDPLLVRVGAVAVVTTLLVPLMLGLRSSDGTETLSSAEPIAEAPSVATDAAVGPVDAAESSGAPVLDPSDLPPAIPARTADTDAVAEPSTRSADESTPNAEQVTSSASDEAQKPSGSSSIADDLTGAGSGVDDGAVADTRADRTEPECDIDFDVRPGDYWIGIADDADVDLADLLTANAATVATSLFPGATICLPAGATIPRPAATPATTAPPTTAPPTTTAPTTTPPPSETVPPGADATPAEVQQIIRDVWPDELEERALDIAFRESRYVPTAKNFCCYGIFQIYWEVHDSWLDDIGITSAQQLYDPATNAKAAYALYQRAGGWGPWQL